MALEKATVPSTSNQQALSAQDIVNIKTVLGIIEDAPQDGNIYGRKDGEWVVINVNPDVTAPVITLNGANPQVIELGDSYTELGATTDDGSAVVIDASAVDTNTLGSYNVTYNAIDDAGNQAQQKIRVVQVVDTTAPATPTITNVTL